MIQQVFLIILLYFEYLFILLQVIYAFPNNSQCSIKYRYIRDCCKLILHLYEYMIDVVIQIPLLEREVFEGPEEVGG